MLDRFLLQELNAELSASGVFGYGLANFGTSPNVHASANAALARSSP